MSRYDAVNEAVAWARRFREKHGPIPSERQAALEWERLQISERTAFINTQAARIAALEAEIARLMEIEEAAREVINAPPIPGTEGMRWVPRVLFDRLTAALAKEPSND